jgi:hypothetical protein
MNTILSDEYIVSLQSSMQFLPTRLPIIVLQMVEEQFPAFSDMQSAERLCGDIRVLSFYFGDLYDSRTEFFLGILCCVSFYVVSAFKDDFVYP